MKKEEERKAKKDQENAKRRQIEIDVFLFMVNNDKNTLGDSGKRNFYCK